MKTFFVKLKAWIIGHKVVSIIIASVLTVGIACSIILPIALKHEHEYATTYSTDATNHWYECECGEKKDIAVHQASAVYSSDETNHWKECSACGYDLSLEAHNYNQEVATDDYLKTAATATTKAVYYKSCICGKAGAETFETNKTIATLTNIVMDGKVYDGTAVVAPTFDKNSDGAVTIEYSVKDANAFTTTAPIDAGEYTVRVTIAETTTHTSVSSTKDFTIAKATVNIGDIDVELANKTYDGNPINEPMYVVDTFVANDDKVVEYKVKGADDSAYTTTAPTDAGEYTVRVKINDSANYNGATKTADFTIEKATASITGVDMYPQTIVYNESYEVMVEKENYDGEVIIEYKAKNADDATYETIKPVNAGEYTARVTLQEGANNTSDVETIDFTINAKVLVDLYEIAIENGDSEFTFDLEEVESGLSIKVTFESSAPGAEVTQVVVLKDGNPTTNYVVDLDECYFAIISNVISTGSIIYVTPANYTINFMAGKYVVEVGNVTGNRDAQVEIYSKADESTPVYEFSLTKNFAFDIEEMESGEYVVKVLASADGYFMINEHNSHETIDDYGFCQTCGEFAGEDLGSSVGWEDVNFTEAGKKFLRFDINNNFAYGIQSSSDDVSYTITVYGMSNDGTFHVIELSETVTKNFESSTDDHFYIVIEADDAGLVEVYLDEQDI